MIFILLIAFGNTLTLIAITKFRNLRHQRSVMIGSLALADLWVGVVYTPVQLLKIHMPVPTENSMFDISVHWTFCCHSSCDIPLSVVAGKGLRSAVPFSLPCPLGNKTCSHSQCWYVCIPQDLFDSNSCRCGKLVRRRRVLCAKYLS